MKDLREINKKIKDDATEKTKARILKLLDDITLPEGVPCEHKNETLIKETMQLGTVTCDDCGREREWDAY